jgi:hypothetical protein
LKEEEAMRRTASVLVYFVGVTALIMGCGVESQVGKRINHDGDQIGAVKNAICSTIAVTPSVASPSTAGTNVAFTAVAGCDQGDTPEYLFAFRGPGEASYTVVQDWSTSDVWTWTQTGTETNGTYNLLVYTRAQGAMATEAWRVISHKITGGVGDTCDTNPLLVAAYDGTNVNLTGSVGCSGTAVAEYSFYAKGPSDSTYTEIRGWSTSATYAWDASSAEQGSWIFLMYTRVENGNGGVDGYDFTSVTVQGCAPADSPDFTTAANLGSRVYRLTTNAGCNAEYKFFYAPPSAPTSFSMIRDWGSATYDWDASGTGETGNHRILVYARRVGGSGSVETWDVINVDVQDSGVCDSTALSFSPSSSVDVGTTVTMTATPTCTLGATGEAQFYVRAPGESTYTLARDWGALTYDWDTTGLADGGYWILVYVRAQGNAVVESFAFSSVTLMTPAP